ncbi:MAG TPA: sugar porter family MFS transporter [Caulobacteraceae bacterium]|nr:sugar porter family MFS transporter [Caulobacteraceae bacterium]
MTGTDIVGDTGLERKANMVFVSAIVAVATIGGFMFGYDSGVINGTQKGLSEAFHLSDLMLGVNVGAVLLGCAAGAFTAGRASDVFGRRNVMIVAAALFIVSALAAGAAATSAEFILARLIGGLGVGAASVLSPVYISEVAPAAVRGRLTTVQQIMIIIGLTGSFVVNWLIAQWAGGSTSVIMGHPAWRWMFWAQVIPAGVFLVSLLFIPESPRFLVARGRLAKAEAVLARLFGADVAKAKAAEISATLAADHHRPRLSDLLDKGRVRPIVWAGIGLAVFQQLVGINVVFYYGAVLWQSVGFSEADSLKINILSGSLSIVSCLISMGFVDKVGRKPILLFGSIGMTVSLAAVAVAFSTATLVNGQAHLPEWAGLTALIAANLYVVFFNGTWGPVMWVMLGEMFPNQIRGSGLAVSGFAQWTANFAISLSFPIAATAVGLVPTYGFYALSAFVSFFFVRAMVHETRGRELEQMTG